MSDLRWPPEAVSPAPGPATGLLLAAALPGELSPDAGVLPQHVMAAKSA